MVIEIEKRELDRYRENIQQQAAEHQRQAERIEEQAERIEQLEERIEELEEEVERLKKLLEGKADAKTAKKPKFAENYSLDRNKRTQQKKNRPKSTGRKPQEAKRDLSTLKVDVYAAGVAREECIRRRSQYAWRLVDGKATYVCYHIYDLPDSRDLPLPPGLRNSRSEFGIEIILILAFLHYWIGGSTKRAGRLGKSRAIRGYSRPRCMCCFAVEFLGRRVKRPLYWENPSAASE